MYIAPFRISYTYDVCTDVYAHVWGEIINTYRHERSKYVIYSVFTHPIVQVIADALSQ